MLGTLLRVLIAVALVVVAPAAILAQQPRREITQIKGDLYRFRHVEGMACHIQMHRREN
jgi:hypothetical protein